SANQENAARGRPMGRRSMLRVTGRLAALSGVGLLAACRAATETIVVTPPPPAATPATPAATAATTAPPTAQSPTAAPTAPPPAPRRAPGAAPKPPAPQPRRPPLAAPGGGRPMYQMDAQPPGRSPYAGPRTVVLRRSFDPGGPAGTADPGDPRPDVQSS